MRGLFSRQKPPSQSPQVPKLEVFRTYKEGVSVEQLLDAVKKENENGSDKLRIATNREIDLVLHSAAREAIREAFPLRTGTGFAYVEPDKTFREGAERVSSLDGHYRPYVVFTDSDTKKRWLFPVPEEYLDVKNGILIVEHPNFRLEKDGNDRIIVAKDNDVDLVGGFPAVNVISPHACQLMWKDFFGSDPKHGIPHGKEVHEIVDAPNIRRIFRTNKLVSLVVRNYIDFPGPVRSVILCERPSNCFGMAVIREKKTRLVFDDPDPYRGTPRLVVVNEEEKSKRETETSESNNEKVGWFDQAKRAIGF